MLQLLLRLSVAPLHLLLLLPVAPGAGGVSAAPISPGVLDAAILLAAAVPVFTSPPSTDDWSSIRRFWSGNEAGAGGPKIYHDPGPGFNHENNININFGRAAPGRRRPAPEGRTYLADFSEPSDSSTLTRKLTVDAGSDTHQKVIKFSHILKEITTDPLLTKEQKSQLFYTAMDFISDSGEVEAEDVVRILLDNLDDREAVKYISLLYDFSGTELIKQLEGMLDSSDEKGTKGDSQKIQLSSDIKDSRFEEDEKEEEDEDEEDEEEDDEYYEDEYDEYEDDEEEGDDYTDDEDDEEDDEEDEEEEEDEYEDDEEGEEEEEEEDEEEEEEYDEEEDEEYEDEEDDKEEEEEYEDEEEDEEEEDEEEEEEDEEDYEAEDGEDYANDVPAPGVFDITAASGSMEKDKIQEPGNDYMDSNGSYDYSKEYSGGSYYYDITPQPKIKKEKNKVEKTSSNETSGGESDVEISTEQSTTKPIAHHGGM